MWEQFYSTKLQHPIISLIILGIFAILYLRQRSPAFWYFATFGIITIIDAIITGGLLSAVLPESVAKVLAIVFVLAGDAKYFILISYLAYNQHKLTVEMPVQVKSSLVLNTLTLTLITPFTTIAVWYAKPEWFASERNIFLVYEVIFTVINILFRISAIPRKLTDNNAIEYKFLMQLNAMFGLQYSLWALSDILILKGYDYGYAIRVIPNLIYYAFFLPLVYVLMKKFLPKN